MPRFLSGPFGEAILVAFIILGLWLVSAHAATTEQDRVTEHVNSLGVLQYFENPNTYLSASIAGGAVVGTKKMGTNIRFQPAHTYGLFTQEVLFCGNQAQKFNGQTGALLVTYKTVAHETIDGIACHELVAIDHLAAKDLQ